MVQFDNRKYVMPMPKFTSSSREGVATVNVIADQLSSFEIIHLPENRKRHIAWVSLYSDEATLRFPVPENVVCFLLPSDRVRDALIKHSTALGLLILEENESIPDYLDQEGTLIKSRLFIIRRNASSPSLAELLGILQTMLFELYQWDALCREIVQRDGSVQELINVSANLFDNWIDITDGTYTLLAHVRDMSPPDTLSKNLVDLGCHSAVQVNAALSTGVFREWAEQSGVNVFTPNELVPFEHITYIIRTGKTYEGHVIMVCNNRPSTRGLLDLFETFARHCERLMVGVHNSADQPPFEGFLTRLLDNDSPRQDYVENQCTIIGIEDSTTFCFTIIDTSGSSYAEQSLLLLSNAKAALPGSLVMLYDNQLVALFHAPNFDSFIITNQLAKLKAFCIQYECTAYRSNVFFSIEDLHVAYEQATATREYRNAIDNSMAINGVSERIPIYRFTDVFVFLLGDSRKTAQHLIEFTAENSHLDIIERLQLDNKVCDLKVLYQYLVNERKSTPTAEQLHMHRNNVLHRVQSIEKRYYLDLDNHFTRQYLLACFRLKINRSAKFRKLLL